MMDVKTKLFNLLHSKGFEPTPIDDTGKETALPEEANVFRCLFKQDGNSLGGLTISIDADMVMTIYFGDDVSSSSKPWYEFLEQLKQFALKHQLAFELKNKDHLKYDMAKRDTLNELSIDTHTRYQNAATKSRQDATDLLNRTNQYDPKIVDKMGNRAERTMKSKNKIQQMQLATDTVAEGRFTHGPGGVKLDRQGNPIPPKVKAPAAPREPRRDTHGLSKEDYQNVWHKIESVVSNIFPDGDPIDYLAPWLKKSGITGYAVGEVLEKACKMNGYKDMYAYYDSFKTGDYGFQEGVSEAKAHDSLHKVTWMSNSANKSEHFDSEQKAKAKVSQLEKSGQYHHIKYTPPKNIAKDQLDEASPDPLTHVYPDTKEGVLEYMQQGGGYNKKFLETLDIPTCIIHPDPQVDGVWAVDSMKSGYRCIIYLAGYKTPGGDIRERNDSEEAGLPMSTMKKLIQNSKLAPKLMRQWVSLGGLDQTDLPKLEKFYTDYFNIRENFDAGKLNVATKDHMINKSATQLTNEAMVDGWMKVKSSSGNLFYVYSDTSKKASTVHSVHLSKGGPALESGKFNKVALVNKIKAGEFDKYLKEDAESVKTPNVDQILEYLTSAYLHLQKHADSYQDFDAITRIYNGLRADLKNDDYDAFDKNYDHYLDKYPDDAVELYDAMFVEAGLPEEEGTIDQFLEICGSVNEGYWDQAMSNTQKSRAERAGKPFVKNPASHDKDGVYKGDKDLAGNPVPKKNESNDRSQIAQEVKRLLATGNKVDWQVPGQMGHVIAVDDNFITLRRWNQPYSKMRYALSITGNPDRKYKIVPKGENQYQVISSDSESSIEEGNNDTKQRKIDQLKRDYANLKRWSDEAHDPAMQNKHRIGASRIKDHLKKQYGVDITEAKAHDSLHKVTWMSNSANKSEHFDSEQKAKAKVSQLEKSGQYHHIKYTPPTNQGVVEGKSENRKLYDKIKSKGVVPSIDRERYTDLSHEGLEGPFRLSNGKVGYYDPKVGKYYDRDSDMYYEHGDLTEGYYPAGKKASYSDNVPNVKIVLQHSRPLEEGERRYRAIEKIYVENVSGERFAVPTNRPGLARVFARHVAEGGSPYDEIGKHISALCEEYTKMAGFVRATRRGQFNESAQALVSAGVDHYTKLRETLGKLTGHRGYTAYFENWTPTLVENANDDGALSEMFSSSNLDPRIEKALPILSKLKPSVTENKSVTALESWADDIVSETTGENQLDEISNDTLAKYKTKAGAQATAADELATGFDEHDPKLASALRQTANKRFKGIVNATKKQFSNDLKRKEKAWDKYQQQRNSMEFTEDADVKETAYGELARGEQEWHQTASASSAPSLPASRPWVLMLNGKTIATDKDVSKLRAIQQKKGGKIVRQGSVAEATGNPGMGSPWEDGYKDGKAQAPYHNPYDQPGEEQDHANYKQGYLKARNDLNKIIRTTPIDESILPKGHKVEVLDKKGKKTTGTIVRYQPEKAGDSPFYVVDIGGRESLEVHPDRILNTITESEGNTAINPQGIPEAFGVSDTKECFTEWEKWTNEVHGLGGRTEHVGDGIILATGFDDEKLGEWDEKSGEGWIDPAGGPVDEEVDMGQADSSLYRNPEGSKHKIAWTTALGKAAEQMGFATFADVPTDKDEELRALARSIRDEHTLAENALARLIQLSK